MHIPDGFLSPQTYLPATIVGAGLLWAAYKQSHINTEKIPMLAGVSAISFVMMLIILPFPGGTTVHLSGIAIIAILFGPWVSMMSVSLVLFIQALIFGEGGFTAFPVNMLALAFLGSFSAVFFYRIFCGISEKLALFFAGWFSIVIPSIFIALVLGIQPLIATDANGAPLFFPFGLKVTLPSVIIPHLLLGVVEGLVTLTMVHFLKTRFKKVFDA
ncbi:MAG: energy-coupling factor ABC transporter permease [Sulfurovum sp.]|nr:energy-coupling factor ABC transporter permease [Sulfurovum sp.]